MTVYLTRKEYFNAAHQLWVDDWTEEENFAQFGKCANKNFHGHNYELMVTVKGRPHPVTGFIMNVKDLGQIMQQYVTDVLDHSNMNLDENFIPKGIMPTTENLVYYIWQELQPHIEAKGAKLHCVELKETRKIWASYYGEEE